MPSAQEIARELGISISPVNRAFQELAAEGYLHLSQGSRAQIISKRPLKLVGATENALLDVGTPMTLLQSNVLLLSMESTDDPVTLLAAKSLNLEKGRPLLLVERVRAMSQEPFARRWDRTFFPADLIKMENLIRNPSGTSLQLLETCKSIGIEPLSQDFTIHVAPAGPEVAAKLIVTEHETVLWREQTSVGHYQSTFQPYEYLLTVFGPSFKLTYRRSFSQPFSISTR
ncbi:MAG: GntR family transcriptional regulator [Magnetococcales bacterium]|nr:GntR family transcriptional regulator [Magnetococcales bacterium]